MVVVETFCTSLPLEERCDGCPLTIREQDESLPQPEAHVLYRLAIETTTFLSQIGPDDTQEDFITHQIHWNDTFEPAYRAVLRRLGNDIANWRTVGGCKYHDGPVITDPELDERMNQLFSKTRLQQGEI